MTRFTLDFFVDLDTADSECEARDKKKFELKRLKFLDLSSYFRIFFDKTKLLKSL